MQIISRKKIITAAVLLGLAAVYVVLLMMDFPCYIPCVFRLTTGLKCPGCGITHMFIALLKLDFASAFNYNPGVFVILPLLIFICERSFLNKTNNTEQKIAVALVIYLAIYFVLRNIYGF